MAGCEPTSHTQLTNMTVRSLDSAPHGGHKSGHSDTTTTTLLGAPVLVPTSHSKTHPTPDTDHSSRVQPPSDASSIKNEGTASKSLKTLTYMYLLLHTAPCRDMTPDLYPYLA